MQLSADCVGLNIWSQISRPGPSRNVGHIAVHFGGSRGGQPRGLEGNGGVRQRRGGLWPWRSGGRGWQLPPSSTRPKGARPIFNHVCIETGPGISSTGEGLLQRVARHDADPGGDDCPPTVPSGKRSRPISVPPQPLPRRLVSTFRGTGFHSFNHGDHSTHGAHYTMHFISSWISLHHEFITSWISLHHELHYIMNCIIYFITSWIHSIMTFIPSWISLHREWYYIIHYTMNFITSWIHYIMNFIPSWNSLHREIHYIMFITSWTWCNELGGFCDRSQGGWLHSIKNFIPSMFLHRYGF